MNEKRRKRLREAIGHLDRARDIVQDCGMEEREAYENLPETIQWSERGERMEEIADSLDEAVGIIEEAIDLTNGAVD